MKSNICFTPGAGSNFKSQDGNLSCLQRVWLIRGKWCLTVLLLLFCLVGHTQEIGNIEGTVLDFNNHPDSATAAWAQKAAPEMTTLLKYLKEQEQKEKKFNGAAQFGFAGDQTDAASLYKINGGIAVSRGYYPDKFEFATDMGLVINNGTFRENVSNVFITYDHSLPKGDSLFLENYMVMSRFSDEFLGIEQRYELGGGFIVAFWSKKLTPAGNAELNRLRKTELLPPEAGSDSVRLCVNGQCANLKRANPQTNDAELVYRARQQANVSLRKKYNRFRLALLSGLIVEAEKVSASDSLITVSGKQNFTQSYAASLHLRWEMRPTLDVKPSDNWTFKIRPYFKLPMPWEWYSTVKSSNGFTSKAIDYRLDVQTNLTIKLADWFNKQASVDIQYRILYDNAPRRSFLDPALSPTTAPLLLAAQKTHQIVRLMFMVRF